MFQPSQVQDSSTRRDAARPHRSSPQQAASTAARVESRVGPWGPLLAQLVESVYICLQCQGGSVGHTGWVKGSRTVPSQRLQPGKIR